MPRFGPRAGRRGTGRRRAGWPRVGRRRADRLRTHHASPLARAPDLLRVFDVLSDESFAGASCRAELLKSGRRLASIDMSRASPETRAASRDVRVALFDGTARRFYAESSSDPSEGSASSASYRVQHPVRLARAASIQLRDPLWLTKRFRAHVSTSRSCNTVSMFIRVHSRLGSQSRVMRAERISSRASPQKSRAPTRARLPFVGRSPARSGAQAHGVATARASPREGGPRGPPPRPPHGALAPGSAEPSTRRGARGDRTRVPRRARARRTPPGPVHAAVEPRPSDRRGGRPGRSVARDARPARSACPRAQPTLVAQGLDLLGSLPCTTAADPARGASGARVRAAQRATSRTADPGVRSVLVGALVRRMEPPDESSARIPRSGGEDLAPEGRMAAVRSDRTRRTRSRGFALIDASPAPRSGDGGEPEPNRYRVPPAAVAFPRSSRAPEAGFAFEGELTPEIELAPASPLPPDAGVAPVLPLAPET